MKIIEPFFVPQYHFDKILLIADYKCPAQLYFDNFGDLMEFEKSFLFKELMDDFEIPDIDILVNDQYNFELRLYINLAVASFSSCTYFVEDNDGAFRMCIKVNDKNSTIIKYLEELSKDQVYKTHAIWLEEMISLATISINCPEEYKKLKDQQKLKAIKWNQYVSSLSNVQYWETNFINKRVL